MDLTRYSSNLLSISPDDIFPQCLKFDGPFEMLKETFFSDLKQSALEFGYHFKEHHVFSSELNLDSKTKQFLKSFIESYSEMKSLPQMESFEIFQKSIGHYKLFNIEIRMDLLQKDLAEKMVESEFCKKFYYANTAPGNSFLMPGLAVVHLQISILARKVYFLFWERETQIFKIDEMGKFFQTFQKSFSHLETKNSQELLNLAVSFFQHFKRLFEKIYTQTPRQHVLYEQATHRTKVIDERDNR